MIVRRWVVVALERACGIVSLGHRLGMGCHLANLSARLDERWRTGMWDWDRPIGPQPDSAEWDQECRDFGCHNPEA